MTQTSNVSKEILPLTDRMLHNLERVQRQLDQLLSDIDNPHKEAPDTDPDDWKDATLHLKDHLNKLKEIIQRLQDAQVEESLNE